MTTQTLSTRPTLKFNDESVETAGVLAALLEATTDGVALIDIFGRIRFVSPNGVAALEIDSFARIEGTAWRSLWPATAQERMAAAVRAAALGETVTVEATRPGGAAKRWSVKLAPIPGEGTVRHILCLTRDVTGQAGRGADAEGGDGRLRDLAIRHSVALREKDEALERLEKALRDADHRMRNSLNIVTSMLRMQAAGADAAEAELLREASNRILTICKAHEQLRKGRETGAICLCDYISSLCAELEVSAGARDMRVEVEAEAIELGADLAIPVGLTVGELLARSSRSRRGRDEIRIAARDRGDGLAEIVIGAEESGESGFAQAEVDDLGMKIATLHARQLGGAIEVAEAAAEASFRFTFRHGAGRASLA